MVIKMMSDKSLAITSTKSKLYQREALTEDVAILIPATYKNQDLTDLVFVAEWKDPGNCAHVESLTKDEDLRDDYMVLRFNVDSKLTYMAGNNILKVTGVSVDEAAEQNIVFKTGEVKIKVEPLNDFFAFVDPSFKNVLDVALSNMKTTVDELGAIQEIQEQSRARDLAYTEKGHINLVNELGESMGDGVDVVTYAGNADGVDDGIVDLDEMPETDVNDITFVDLD